MRQERGAGQRAGARWRWREGGQLPDKYQSTIDIPSVGVVYSLVCAGCRRMSVCAGGEQRADAVSLANAWLGPGIWQGQKAAETGSLLRRATLRAEDGIMKSAGLLRVFSWLAIVAVVATMAPPVLSSNAYVNRGG